jgi:tetratricopeptide (TPR) repeat protein
MPLLGWRFRRSSTALLVCVAAIGTSFAAAASTFDEAGSAFAAGDYARALDLFEAVRAAGDDAPALHYNIGVCQYKLGHFVDAEATFRQIAERFPSLRNIAEYNRALALTALGRHGAAREALDAAQAGADPTVAQLANALRRRLDALEAAEPARQAWNGLVDAAAGHDDNVALIDELSLPAGQSADSSFRELLSVASRDFGAQRLFRLDLAGYFVRFQDVPDYDQDWIRVGGEVSWSAGAWRIAAGPRLAASALGGNGFDRELGVSVLASRSLGEQARFEVRGAYDSVDSLDSRYDYVAGSRRQMGLLFDLAAGKGRLRVGLESEINDRDSASVSSDRWRALLRYRRALAPRWSLDGYLAYRTSRYSELPVPREEDLTELDVVTQRALGRGWLLAFDYRYSNNDSTATGYAYTAARLSAGIGKAF